MQDTKQVIKQVKKIEIVTRHLVDSLIAGNYRSIFKGQGIEFSEIRDYRAGDDVRAIDWKVTARFDKPFIKEFIEERDLNVYFVFDYSGSGDFGNRIRKISKAIELSATLMFSSSRNNDNVGLFIFTDDVELFVPARKGRKHVLKLLSLLIAHDPKSKTTDINKSLYTISNIIKKRSVLFIISDFYDDNFLKPLKILKSRHDVIALRMIDDRENSLPDVGLIQLEDEETGEQILVDTSDENFRNSYSEITSAFVKKLDHLFKKHHIDSINIVTDEPYEVPLRKFFRIRKKRMVR